MKNITKKYSGIIKLVLCFIIFFLTPTCFALLLDLFKIDYLSDPNVNLIATFIANILRTILIFLLFFKDVKEDFKKIKGHFWEYSDIAVKYWLIGLVVMAVTNIAIQLLTPSKMAVNEGNVREMIKMAPVFMLILTTLSAPISEELLFRKSFKNVISDKITYIVISGLVFGAMHVVTSYSSLYDLLYLIPYSALGISLASICWKTDNILPTMIVHAIHNGAITIVTIVTALSSGMIL